MTVDSAELLSLVAEASAYTAIVKNQVTTHGNDGFARELVTAQEKLALALDNLNTRVLDLETP